MIVTMWQITASGRRERMACEVERLAGVLRLTFGRAAALDMVGMVTAGGVWRHAGRDGSVLSVLAE